MTDPNDLLDAFDTIGERGFGGHLSYMGDKGTKVTPYAALIPAYESFTESFGGMGAMTRWALIDAWIQDDALADAPRVVWNELDDDNVNVFRVIQEQAGTLADRLTAVVNDYSFYRFAARYHRSSLCSPVERAVRYLVKLNNAIQTAGGANRSTSGYRFVRRMSQMPGFIRLYGQMFRLLDIQQRPAIDVIQSEDYAGCFHFVDPPYLETTRKHSYSYYRHEMRTEAEHAPLLDTLRGCRGNVMLCGYPSKFYERELRGWRSIGPFNNYSARKRSNGREHQQETVWINFDVDDATAASVVCRWPI